MNLLNFVREIEKDVVEYRHHIHRNPELSLQEFETADYVESILKTVAGIDSVRRISPTGILAEIKGTGPGESRCIVLRGDMDALPGEEKADVPYKSTRPGVVHSCGHDVHTALLLGAVRIFAGYKNKFAGTAKFFSSLQRKYSEVQSSFSRQELLMTKGWMQPWDHVFPDLDAGIIASRKAPCSSSRWFVDRDPGPSVMQPIPTRDGGCDRHSVPGGRSPADSFIPFRFPYGSGCGDDRAVQRRNSRQYNCRQREAEGDYPHGQAGDKGKRPQ